MKYVHYLWLLFVLKQSSGVPTTNNGYEKLPSASGSGSTTLRRPGKSMRNVVTGATLSQKNTFNYQMNKFRITKRIYLGTYCKNTYSPEEAEILLHMDMDFHIPRNNWWRHTTATGRRKIPNPVCSHIPNAKIATTKLSEHEFFESQIDIPIKEGERNTRSTGFEHFKYAPAWKEFMQCDCTILEGASSEECFEGKINFSRGVGGDASFFVHVPKPPTEDEEGPPTKEFKVVAHICFP